MATDPLDYIGAKNVRFRLVVTVDHPEAPEYSFDQILEGKAEEFEMKLSETSPGTWDLFVRGFARNHRAPVPGMYEVAVVEVGHGPPRFETVWRRRDT